MPTEPTVKSYTFIALGKNSWGVGNTPTEAKRNQRSANGGRDKTIQVGHWSEPVTDVTVSGWGEVQWINKSATLTWLDREAS